MFDMIKKDLEDAIAKIKWFASLLSERLRIEIEVFKLFYKSEELKKRKEELFKKIGEEVYELRGKEKNIYSVKEIAEAIKDIDLLESEIKQTLEKASEISSITA